MKEDGQEVLKGKSARSKILYPAGIIAFLYLIYKSGIFELKNILIDSNSVYLAAGVLVVILDIFILALRWHYLLLIFSGKSEFRNLLGILATGSSFGYIFPKLGFPIRVGMLSKYGYAIKESTASVIIESILDVSSLTVLAFLSSWFLFKSKGFLVLPFVFILTFALIRIGWQWIKPKFKFLEGIKLDKNLKMAGILTLLTWGVACILIYILALGIGLRISFFKLSAVFLISYAIGVVSLIPGGFGARDVSLVALLSNFGVGTNASTALTILYRAVTIGVFAIFALGFNIVPWYRWHQQYQPNYLENLKYRKVEYLSARQHKASNIIKILRSEGVELENKLILDIGCSHGVITAELASKGNHVVGLDLDVESIKRAPKNKNFDYIVGDGADLPFKSLSIDIVICNHVIEHTPNQTGLMNEIYRVLQHSGVCYFACPNRFFFIDPEYGLPFLSFLPRPLASVLLQVTKRGEYYNERLPTYWSLSRLLKRFEVKNFTISVIKSDDYFTPEIPKAIKKLLHVFPDKLLKIFMPVARSWIMVLRK